MYSVLVLSLSYYILPLKHNITLSTPTQLPEPATTTGKEAEQNKSLEIPVLVGSMVWKNKKLKKRVSEYFLIASQYYALTSSD